MNNKTTSFLFLTASVLFLLQSIFYVYNVGTWLDEGVYLYIGHNFATGKLFPYRDIITQYPILSFYIPGFVQKILGPSFIIGRLFSVFLCFFTIIFVYLIAKHIGGNFAGLISVWLFVANTHLVQSYSTIVPYSQTTFFLIGSLFFLILPSRSEVLKIFFSLLFMTFAIFTRQTVILSFPILVIYLLFFYKEWKYRFLTIFLSFLFPFLLLLPFLSYSEKISFYHTLFIGPKFNLALWNITTGKGAFKTFNITYLKMLKLIQEFFKIYSLILILMLSSFFSFIFIKGWQNFKSEMKKKNSLIFLIIVLFAINLFVHIWMGSRWGKATLIGYMLYFMPLGIILAGVFTSYLYEISNNDMKKILTTFIICGIIINLVTLGLGKIQLPLSYSPWTKVNKYANTIKKYTNPEDKIFFWGLPHYLFMAKRSTYSPLVYNIFYYTDSKDTKIVKKFNLFNEEMVNYWLSYDANFVILIEDEFKKDFARKKDNARVSLYNLIQNKTNSNFNLIARINSLKIYKRIKGK